MIYLFFPVHECLVCIPDGFLLLLWQQERWPAWRGFGSFQLSRPVMSDSLQPMDFSIPGFPVHYHLLELAQTHVNQVGDAIQPSHALSSSFPPTFHLSQHQGLFQ